MRIVFQKSFEKQYIKLPKKIREQFETRLILLINDRNSPNLHIHKLKGTYDGLWSLNITGDIRAVFDKSHESTITFVAIGSHSELYS
ncbi:MAG: type II toxin-antitoxin system mRNA interferase toxin, RelE/StbE family [Parcubacteria group bacterium]|nr:type II toxin-antitoxin system mRNA interferase toxin, RelE/StbE family [Parcubacteria group bacterium]